MSQALPPNGQSKVYDNKGRTLVPKEVRDALGIKKGDKLQYVADDDCILITVVEDEK